MANDNPPERITPLPFEYHWRMSISPLPWFAKEEGRLTSIESKAHGQVCLINDASIVDEANGKYIVEACNNYPKLEALNMELVEAMEFVLENYGVPSHIYDSGRHKAIVETLQKAKGGV